VILRIFRRAFIGLLISLLLTVPVLAEGGALMGPPSRTMSGLGITENNVQQGAAIGAKSSTINSEQSNASSITGIESLGSPTVGSEPDMQTNVPKNAPPGELPPTVTEIPSSAEIYFNADGTGQVGGGESGIQPAAPVETKLLQFGYDFFRNGEFKPNQQALVGPDYVIGPGDSLRIDVWGNIEGNYPVTVDRNGEITLPKVGVINLWGQTFAQTKETIRKQISKYFKDFELNVTMGGLRSIQIFLVGEVSSPGTYQVSSLSTLVTALSSAGGPAKSGSLRKIELLRNGKRVQTIDLYDFFLRGDKSADIRLQSGDTIFVPIVGPLVGVAGNVRRPAIYELKGEETVRDALDLAGGLIPTAYLQKVQVNRVETHKSRIVLDLNLNAGDSSDNAMQMTLQDRDLIKVAPIAIATGYVTLDGFAARPGRYQLTPGMRLKDLILPYDNLLPEFYPGLAQITRLNPPEYRPGILTVNLGKALQGDPQHNLLLQEYDTVKLFSRWQMEETPQVVVSGAVLIPGNYQLYEHMTVKDLVTLAGNVKRTAFLGDAEITRYLPSGLETKTERLTIDLQKALQGDPLNNLELLPDDHLFVRNVPDSGEKFFVQVQGEVLFPGQYAIAKGERLSSVLTRAGGFTNKAYLRGAVFQRESLKAIQRQQLDKLIFEQEQAIYRTSADLASGAFDATEVAAAQAILDSRKQLIEKLKQSPVTGRMVIHLADLKTFPGTPSDVEVLPGDTIIIPENPKSVSVLGEVYNPTSLTYVPGKSVSYYLTEVGGAKTSAEKSDMFIIRANGTVLSKQQSGLGVKWDSENWRWVFGGFNVTELYPGDAVLVPEKVKSTDVMREVKDVTTIIYQMALGAAAVASF